MQYKTTNKLFRGTYQYKVVLVCAGSGYFRDGDMTNTLGILGGIVLDGTSKHIKTQEQLEYAVALAKVIKKCNDVQIRVESPWISVYTNSKKDVDSLVKIAPNNVKYISKPPDGVQMQVGTIIMSKRDFDYKITLGRTRHSNIPFIEWADTNSKVQLTKTCIRDLNKDRSWGGSHFYISGDNMLLVAKMHLGDSISKIERIIKK